MTRSLLVAAADDSFGQDWLAANADALIAKPARILLLAEPESPGVGHITPDGVTLRLVVRSAGADQWRVGRELRMRPKERFVTEGIRTPVPLFAGAGGNGAGSR